jgi:hypothetical protein
MPHSEAKFCCVFTWQHSTGLRIPCNRLTGLSARDKHLSTTKSVGPEQGCQISKTASKIIVQLCLEVLPRPSVRTDYRWRVGVVSGGETQGKVEQLPGDENNGRPSTLLSSKSAVYSVRIEPQIRLDTLSCGGGRGKCQKDSQGRQMQVSAATYDVSTLYREGKHIQFSIAKTSRTISGNHVRQQKRKKVPRALNYSQEKEEGRTDRVQVRERERERAKEKESEREREREGCARLSPRVRIRPQAKTSRVSSQVLCKIYLVNLAKKKCALNN